MTSRDSDSLRAEPKAPYYEQVAAKRIEQLVAGTAPWRKPWEPDWLLGTVDWQEQRRRCEGLKREISAATRTGVERVEAVA